MVSTITSTSTTHGFPLFSSSIPAFPHYACKTLVSNTINSLVQSISPNQSSIVSTASSFLPLYLSLPATGNPFPIDNPLTTPWSENITTFAEALNSTLQFNYSQPLPTVMRAIDRCWCDFSSGGFFEPFNVSKWEHLSVERLSKELQRKALEGDNVTTSVNQTDILSTNTTIDTGLMDSQATTFWWLRPFSSKSSIQPIEGLSINATNSGPSTHFEPTPSSTMDVPSPEPSHSLTSGGCEQDLRKYGLGIVLDFGWS